MQRLKILYVASEVSPIINQTKVGNFAQKLPIYMQERDCDVRIFVPKFGTLNERRNKIHQVARLSGLNVVVDDKQDELLVKSTSLQDQKIQLQIYFIDGVLHFKNKEMFVDSCDNFLPNNDTRSIFFCKGVLETLTLLDWSPDIIHCHDWFTAFMPIIIRYNHAGNPIFKNVKTIFTVYNNRFNESFEGNLQKKLNLNEVPSSGVFEKSSFSMTDVLNLGASCADMSFLAEELDSTFFSDFLSSNNLELIDNSAEGLQRYYELYQGLVQ